DCVSRNWEGNRANGLSHKSDISGNGRYVAFESEASDLLPPGVDTNGKIDIFVRDMTTRSTVRVNLSTSDQQALGENSGYAAISSAGRFVVFSSSATNLVPVPASTGLQCYVRDRDVSGSGIFDKPGNVSTQRLSETPAGDVALKKSGGNADMTADGRFAVF